MAETAESGVIVEKLKVYDYDPVDFIKTEEEWDIYIAECKKLDGGDGRLVRLAVEDRDRALEKARPAHDPKVRFAVA